MSDMLVDPMDIVYQSKCYTCKHRLVRKIEPTSIEDLEFYLEDIDFEDDDDYDIFIEQHKCLITDEDILGIVRECNMYTPRNKYKLIREYRHL